MEKKIFIALALFATALLFIISPDSYAHDLYGRCDSAWFFMCGKAWMEGLTPYVDFADSKGPLLWLIYGIGYLISPHNYIGVFWLSCLWYAVIFYITYLIAKIFLSGHCLPLTCAILMALAFFNPMFHYETRAEDWSMLFLTASMYLTCKTLYTNDIDRKHSNATFFLLGSCFASLVLIKYNIAAMQTIFILFAIFHTIRCHDTLLPPLLLLLAGMAVVSVPFIVYLLHRGCYDAFIQEYFKNTLYTTGQPSNFLTTYIYEWRKVFTNHHQFVLLFIILLGGIISFFHLKRYRLFPAISMLFIFAITLRHAFWDYYFNICATCYIWALLLLIQPFHVPHRLRKAIPLALSALVILTLTTKHLHVDLQNQQLMFWENGEKRQEFYTTEYLISQVHNPTIINALANERGRGILSSALPGGKYWSYQHGSTKPMHEKHVQDILSQKADFIWYDPINTKSTDARINEKNIQAAGYRYCYNHHLYSKIRLKEPPTPIHVTNWEVLTKQIPKALKR